MVVMMMHGDIERKLIADTCKIYNRLPTCVLYLYEHQVAGCWGAWDGGGGVSLQDWWTNLEKSIKAFRITRKLVYMCGCLASGLLYPPPFSGDE